MCLLGAFAEHTVVSQANCIKIDDDLPLDVACLLGCGVITGWGAVTYTGEAKAGRHGGGRRRRRDRHQRRAGRGRQRARSTSSPWTPCLQAGEGPGVRRHPRRGDQRGGHGALTELTRGRMAQVCVNTMGVGEGRADRRRAWRWWASGAGSSSPTSTGRRRRRSSMSALGADADGEAGQGLAVRFLQPAGRHPPHAGAVPQRQAQAGGAAHADLPLDDINTGYDDMLNGRNLRGVITFS